MRLVLQIGTAWKDRATVKSTLDGKVERSFQVLVNLFFNSPNHLWLNILRLL